MSVTDPTLGSFGSEPIAGLEVADPFEVGGLDTFLDDSTLDFESESMTSVVTTVSPNQVLELQESPEFTEMVTENGGDLGVTINTVTTDLPSGANDFGNLVTAVGADGIPAATKNAARLKESMPSDEYNSLSPSVFEKCMTFASDITNELSPLGDYFCKLLTNGNVGGGGLDDAIRIALEAAKGAVASLNLCGFNVIAFIDDIDMSDDYKKIIGKTIARDSAKNGGLSSVSELLVKYDADISDGERSTMASDLSSSFESGASTLTDETGIFTDTMTDLEPDFAVPNSPKRLDLLSNMSPASLVGLEGDNAYRADAAITGMAKDGMGDIAAKLKSQYKDLL